MEKYILVIPARYDSKRLPGKPLIDIEDFSKRKFTRSFFNSSSFITQVLSITCNFVISATVSTWPWIKCPDIFWPYKIDFSKLIIWFFFNK